MGRFLTATNLRTLRQAEAISLGGTMLNCKLLRSRQTVHLVLGEKQVSEYPVYRSIDRGERSMSGIA
jgi:hypothetical protein